MALPGTRPAIRRPLPAYISTAADKKASRPIRDAPVRRVFSATSTRSAASTARVNAVSDQATRRVRGWRTDPTSPMMTTLRRHRSGNVTADACSGYRRHRVTAGAPGDYRTDGLVPVRASLGYPGRQVTLLFYLPPGEAP